LLIFTVAEAKSGKTILKLKMRHISFNDVKTKKKALKKSPLSNYYEKTNWLLTIDISFGNFIPINHVKEIIDISTTFVLMF